MRAFLILASLTVLVAAEPPTGYSHRSSSSELNFQPVPSVAQIHIPPSASPRSSHGHPTSSISSPSGLVPSSPTSHYARYAAPPQSLTTATAAGGSSSGTVSNHYHQHQSHHHESTAYSSPQASYASSPPSSPTHHSAYSTPTQAAAYSSQQTTYNSPQFQSYPYPQIQIQTQPQYSSAPQIQSSTQQQQQYALPPQQYSNPANVQVNYGAPSLPQGASYGPPPVVTGAGPDHNIEYRVVYVKGPKAPKPDLILPPERKQKTIVYILIPRYEPPEPIIVPTHPPTPPSKPEVYFIRYKATKKNKQLSGSSLSKSEPSLEYGAPFGAASGPKPVVVNAPTPSNRKRSTETLTTTTSKTTTRAPVTTTTTIPAAETVTVAFGDRVKKQ